MTTNLERIVALDALAVRHSIALVHPVEPADLSRPTPCADWTLGDLLAHMAAQHRGFAAAAAGQGHDLAHWAVSPLGADPAGRYVRDAEEVLAAFGAVDPPDRGFLLPEITTARTFRADIAIGFHLIDYVVHSWDVAAALGRPFDPEPDLIDAALPIALAVPDDGSRRKPDSLFAPALPPPPAAAAPPAPFARILLALGRSPAWSPPPLSSRST